MQNSWEKSHSLLWGLPYHVLSGDSTRVVCHTWILIPVPFSLLPSCVTTSLLHSRSSSCPSLCFSTHLYWGQGDCCWFCALVGSLPCRDGIGLGRAGLRVVPGLVGVMAPARFQMLSCLPQGWWMHYIASPHPRPSVHGEQPQPTWGDPVCAEHSGSKGVNLEKQSPILQC